MPPPRVFCRPTLNGGTQTISFQSIYNGETLTTSRFVFVPPQAESFTYDDDGNLLADGLWNYYYNAADQLVEAVSKHKDQTGNRVGLRFIYDYMGRRAAKHVFDADNTTGLIDSNSPRSKTLFVYEGWTLIAEYDCGTGSLPVLALKRTFTWGPDLTGGSGAGGIGGLLAIQDHRTNWQGIFNPALDGNGNVTALVEASTGTIVASYEYDSYGNTVRFSGVYAMENPIKFSTKYHDNETGLVYFGFRYYCPSIGRFINRDPLREAGGINIYAFTRNNPINRGDYLGLCAYCGGTCWDFDDNGNYIGDGWDGWDEWDGWDGWGWADDWLDAWLDDFLNTGFNNDANFTDWFGGDQMGSNGAGSPPVSELSEGVTSNGNPDYSNIPIKSGNDPSSSSAMDGTGTQNMQTAAHLYEVANMIDKVLGINGSPSEALKTSSLEKITSPSITLAQGQFGICESTPKTGLNVAYAATASMSISGVSLNQSVFASNIANPRNLSFGVALSQSISFSGRTSVSAYIGGNYRW